MIQHQPKHDAGHDPGHERWTAAPLPVDEKWLERFTRGIRLRGSEGSGAVESIDFGDAYERELLRQPPRRVAA